MIKIDKKIIVCATDDGENYSTEHFGSVKKYLFYELDQKTGETKFIKEINNTSIEEEKHADPEKAKSVSNMLQKAHILINLVFGPNIIKMKQKFIPIISKEKNINKSLEQIPKIIIDLNTYLDKKGEKKIFYLQK